MAKVLGTFYNAETQRRGVTPVSPPNAVDDPVDPVNPAGSGPTTYKTLGDTTDKDFLGKEGMVPVVVGNVLTLQPLPNATQDGLISPGVVQWTGIGYNFNVDSALARFQGVYPLISDPDILTLTTPDATNDRIDLFILQILFDGDGIPNGMEADFITGTPAGSPVKPQINPATQIELTQVLVTAASSTPTLTEEIVYDENTEWTGSTAGTGTGVFNSAVDPYQGSVSVETTNIQNGFQVQFNNGSEVDISGFQTFGFQINLKANLGANQNLYVTFLDGSLNAVSNFVLINLNKTLLGYQFIGIALNAVSFTSFDVQYVRFSFVRTGGSPVYSGYFLDVVKFEGGINPPITSGTFLQLSDTPSSYIGQAGKTVAVKADETGLEFITGGGGGITGSGTTNEIAYFTGATAIGALAVATYPNLTELSYVKGVTSALQTQLNGKQATIAGTLTNGHVATIVAGVPTWAAPTAGSSNWTVVGSDIYRNSAVAIGRTTIPTNATFVAQSLSATDTHKFFNLFDNSGAELFSLTQNGQFNLVSSANGTQCAFTAKNSTASDSALIFRLLDNTDTVRFVVTKIRSQFSNRLLIEAPALSPGQDGTLKVNNTNATATTRILELFQNGALRLAALGDRLVWELSYFAVGSPSSQITTGTTIKTGLSTDVAQFRIDNSSNSTIFQVNGLGRVTLRDAGDLTVGTTTGTKIGTATSQKLAFWNKTPIIQPTNAITAAAFVANTSGIANDTATYGGYTMGQIAAALINTGILA